MQEGLINKGGERLNKNSEQPIISLGNVLIAFLVVVAGIVVFLWVSSSQNERKADLEKDILSLEEDARYYLMAKEEYTPSELNKSIAEDKINIKEKFDQKKEEIQKVATKVYDETKTEKDYNKLKDELPPILGEQLTDKLIELAQPVVNDSGTAAFPYGKMTDLKIAFGEYNIVDHTAKIFVLVDYQSPKIGSNNPGVKREDRTAVITGKDFFILDYNLTDDSLRLVDHQQQLKSEVKADESN